MSGIEIRTRNFRVLERLAWSPEGLCVLSGANGTGKSTALDALRFLRTLFTFGHEAAFAAVDGAAFRRLDAPSEEPVEFSVKVGDLTWELKFPMSAQGMNAPYGEGLFYQGAWVADASTFAQEGLLDGAPANRDERRCLAKILWDRTSDPWMRPLVDLLEGIRTHETYWLNQVKRPQSIESTDAFLHHTGKNLWSVLANWKASPIRYRGQFDWVLRETRRAFPGLLGTIEFDRGLPFLYRPGASDPADGLPPSRAADGLLTGLLHLTAVAGAKEGSIIAFDEVENQLHPHAIRAILSAMRAQAEERNLTIIITTHSPVVLNQFRDTPEDVFVLGHSSSDLPMPARMTDLHSEEWLAQAKLGTLYERLAFGAPALLQDTE
jgi:hypothetical protein